MSVQISFGNVGDLDDEGVKLIGLEVRLIRSIYLKLGDAPCKEVRSICAHVGSLAPCSARGSMCRITDIFRLSTLSLLPLLELPPE